MTNNVYMKLLTVQSKLKAPKNQRNKFGNYNYRSTEDILEALKPILAEVNAICVITDGIFYKEGRHYVEATVKFVDVETGESVESKGFAREEESKKGMDTMQLTGATSSYARKYALNGLFAIDDTKDSDYQIENKDNENNKSNGEYKNNKNLSEKQIKRLYAIAKGAGFNADDIKKHIKAKFGILHIHNLSKKQYDIMCEGYGEVQK